MSKEDPSIVDDVPENKKKTYKVPVSWEMSALMLIEANSPKEALKEAEDAELPKNGEYLGCSFQINEEIFRELNDIDEDVDLDF